LLKSVPSTRASFVKPVGPIGGPVSLGQGGLIKDIKELSIAFIVMTEQRHVKASNRRKVGGNDAVMRGTRGILHMGRIGKQRINAPGPQQIKALFKVLQGHPVNHRIGQGQWRRGKLFQATNQNLILAAKVNIFAGEQPDFEA